MEKNLEIISNDKRKITSKLNAKKAGIVKNENIKKKKDKNEQNLKISDYEKAVKLAKIGKTHDEISDLSEEEDIDDEKVDLKTTSKKQKTSIDMLMQEILKTNNTLNDLTLLKKEKIDAIKLKSILPIEDKKTNPRKKIFHI